MRRVRGGAQGIEQRAAVAVLLKQRRHVLMRLLCVRLQAAEARHDVWVLQRFKYEGLGLKHVTKAVGHVDRLLCLRRNYTTMTVRRS